MMSAPASKKRLKRANCSKRAKTGGGERWNRALRLNSPTEIHRGSRIEDRGSKIEDRRSKIEDRRSKIEDRRSKIKDRRSKIEDRRSKIEDRRSKIEDRRSKINDRGLKIMPSRVRRSSILDHRSSSLRERGKEWQTTRSASVRFRARPGSTTIFSTTSTASRGFTNPAAWTFRLWRRALKRSPRKRSRATPWLTRSPIRTPGPARAI